MTRKKGKAKPVTLAGKRVYLRPFGGDDLKHLRRWYDDPEIRTMTGEVEPMSRAEAARFLNKLKVDEDRMWFAVVLKDVDRVIGEAGLLRMFRPWKCTDMTVIIGEKDMWGKGYGTEAGRLILDHAFGKLGFHRVSIGVVGLNDRALAFWKGLGFKKEGVQRDGYLLDGEYSDFVMMSILEDEYKHA